MTFLDRFFGPTYEKELKAVKPLVADINAKEEGIAVLSIEEIQAAVLKLKERVQSGESLDDVLAEAFALTREAAKRTLGLRHYDVQLIGGMNLHLGRSL